MKPFQLDSSVPFAAKLNPGLRQAAFATKESVLDGQISSYGGNSLYGQMIPGTQIPYNESTELQSLIWEAYEEAGMALPDDFEDMLKKNPGPTGPDDWWNYAPGKNGFGLDGTVPNPSLKTGTVVSSTTGKSLTGFVI